MGYIRRSGQDFVLDGEKITFRGIGLGSWLNIEHFMLGLPTVHSGILKALTDCFGTARAEEFYASFIDNFVREEDIAFLKESGVNLVRLPFHYRLFFSDEHPEEWKEDGFRYIDRLMELARKYQIYVLLDLHAAPGNQNPDWHSDNGHGMTLFWTYRVFREQAVRLWKYIAEHYQKEETLLGYDLLNEPVLPKGERAKLQEYYDLATEAIRSEDTNHLIFLEGDRYAMDFDCLGPIRDDQTALSFHYYPLVWDPSPGRPDYPRQERRRRFDEAFMPMLDCMRSFERPLLSGEAGFDIAGHEKEHVFAMFEDLVDVFNRHDLSWVLWSYKDIGFMSMVYPKEGTAWRELADRVHTQWNHYWEQNKAEELVEEMSACFEGSAPADIRQELRFRQQTLLSVLQREQILKPLLTRMGWDKLKHLPEDWRLARCDYYEEYRALFTRSSL